MPGTRIVNCCRRVDGEKVSGTFSDATLRSAYSAEVPMNRDEGRKRPALRSRPDGIGRRSSVSAPPCGARGRASSSAGISRLTAAKRVRYRVEVSLYAELTWRAAQCMPVFIPPEQVLDLRRGTSRLIRRRQGYGGQVPQARLVQLRRFLTRLLDPSFHDLRRRTSRLTPQASSPSTTSSSPQVAL